MVVKEESSGASVVQKDWSKALICGIIMMSVAFMRCTPVTENETLFHIVLIAPIVTVLMGGYLFAYRGSNSRITRTIFIIFFLLSLLILFGYLYMLALGKAFKN